MLKSNLTLPFFTLICAPVGVRLRAVAVLQSIGPGALVAGVGEEAGADAVPALVALRPLALVDPLAAVLHADAVPLPVLPLALVRCTAI